MLSLKGLIPVLLLLSGASLLAFSVISGSTQMFMFLIFPVFSGSSLLFFVSALLIIAGFLTAPFFFLGGLYEIAPYEKNAGIISEEKDNVKIRTGGVIFIGPIPVIIAGDRRTAFYTMIVTLAVLLCLLFFLFIGYS